jgi:hypothetical protein
MIIVCVRGRWWAGMETWCGVCWLLVYLTMRFKRICYSGVC